MNIYKIENYNTIFGISPKCGCSTLKAYIMKCQGIEPDISDVHEQFFKIEKDYIITEQPDEKILKVLFIRHPLKRFLSGYIQRLMTYPVEYGNYSLRDWLDILNEHNLDLIGYIKQNDIYHHFDLQSNQVNSSYDILWDYILDIDDGIESHINKLNHKYNLPILPPTKLLKMPKKENAGMFCGDIRHRNIVNNRLISNNMDEWFDYNMKQTMLSIYKKDFELYARKNEIKD